MKKAKEYQRFFVPLEPEKGRTQELEAELGRLKASVVQEFTLGLSFLLWLAMALLLVVYGLGKFFSSEMTSDIWGYMVLVSFGAARYHQRRKFLRIDRAQQRRIRSVYGELQATRRTIADRQLWQRINEVYIRDESLPRPSAQRAQLAAQRLLNSRVPLSRLASSSKTFSSFPPTAQRRRRRQQ